MSDKQKYLQVIDQQAGTFTGVSDKIWEYAELSLMEFQSAKLYCEVLEKEGFTVETPVAGIQTAFKASYGSGKPVIGILAEFDALSGLSQEAGAAERKELVPGGNGHGCGHNMLGAGSLAAAFAVKNIWRTAIPAPSSSTAAPARRAARPRPSWPATASGRSWTPR